MGGFTYSLMNTRMLLNIIIRACGEDPEKQLFLTDNPLTDCAFFANSRKLVIVNNSDQIQETSIKTDGKTVNMRMDPFEEKEIDL
jgi:beta-D-galactosyl-(1->4)-L-rhamnose phosphorylase